MQTRDDSELQSVNSFRIYGASEHQAEPYRADVVGVKVECRYPSGLPAL